MANDDTKLLRLFIEQVRSDYKAAHAEIMRLQGADPDKFTWPEWSPQANTLRWIESHIEPAIARLEAAK